MEVGGRHCASVCRVSSRAGAWKRDGGRLQRAAAGHMRSAGPYEEVEHEVSPAERGGILVGAATRSNGGRWMNAPTGDPGDGRPPAHHSLGFRSEMIAEETDTLIDTVMDHDTQLQGGFSVGQPVWHAGGEQHHGVGY